RVDVRKSNNAGLHCFHLDLLGELEDALWIGSRSDHKAHWKTVTASKRRRHHGEHLNTGDGTELLLHHWQISGGRRFASPPRFEHHSTKTAVRICNLKCKARVRHVFENLSRRVSVANRIVDRGIRWSGDDAEDNALGFTRRQIRLCE